MFKNFSLRIPTLLALLVSTTNVIGSSLEEPGGYTERNWGGSSTFKRIIELEQEDVVDVRSNIRIRDNFNRIDKQVKSLKKESNNLDDIYSNLLPQVSTLRTCVSSCVRSEFSVVTEEGGGEQKTGSRFDGRKMENQCLRPYEGFLNQVVSKKYTLPNVRSFSNLGERSGWYERNVGLSATYGRIKELAAEGNLELDVNVRIRDNLNRVRRQVFHLKDEVNGKIEKFQRPRELLGCLRISHQNMVAQINPDFQKIQGEFNKCFHKLDSIPS